MIYLLQGMTEAGMESYDLMIDWKTILNSAFAAFGIMKTWTGTSYE